MVLALQKSVRVTELAEGEHPAIGYQLIVNVEI